MGWRVRLRSWFDSTMDRGTPALIGWLGLASLALVAVATGLALLLAPADTAAARDGWVGIAWTTLLTALDPGMIGGNQGTAVFVVLMFVVTLGGIFIVSTLIGVLTTGLNNRIAQLRKGHTPVIARGHTVILGWSDQTYIIIAELVKANRGGQRSTVVVLADQDKVEMEDQIRVRVGDLGRVRVICRSGSPLKRADLELASLDTARSVIVLGPPSQNPDIDVIKVLLLLNNRPWSALRPPVVAAIHKAENVAAGRLAAGPDALIIDAEDIAVHLVVQSHRQSGLSSVCVDLLDFAGNELYLRDEPALVGRTYGEVLDAYELGTPIGLERAGGMVEVNAAMDSMVEEKDRIIVLAEDDLLIRLADEPVDIMADAIVTVPDQARVPERTLLLGWNARGGRIVELLDAFVAPGSVIDVASREQPTAAMTMPRANLTIGHKPCEPTSRSSLEQLDLATYQHVIVLSDDAIDPDHADDLTLMTLLHLRDIGVALGNPYSIVTEMQDETNREVAQVTKADDFIVGTKLISLLMTQLAENHHLQRVFTDLFDPTGSEIYLKPATEYVRPDTEVNFATVVESARRRGETAIGYRQHSRQHEPPSYGVVLNPDRSAPLSLSTNDVVVVVAELN
ncbi:MAG: CASTOR/POLLUX-related putative ion channel [Micromonosporaceae bacterium]